MIDTRELVRAIKTLDPDQGRIGRRNARRRVLKALADIRIEMDEAFPAILPTRKEPKKRRPMDKGLRRQSIIDDLIARGWEQATTGQLIGMIAELKLPAKQVMTPAGHVIVYTPRWVVAIGPNKARLRFAKTSRSVQEAAVATSLLKVLK